MAASLGTGIVGSQSQSGLQRDQEAEIHRNSRKPWQNAVLLRFWIDMAEVKDEV